MKHEGTVARHLDFMQAEGGVLSQGISQEEFIGQDLEEPGLT